MIFYRVRFMVSDTRNVLDPIKSVQKWHVFLTIVYQMTKERPGLRILFKKPKKCFGNSAMFLNNLAFGLLLLFISPKFYEQLLHLFPFAKKLQSQTVIREKLRKALSYKKAALKMLVKLKPARPCKHFRWCPRAPCYCSPPLPCLQRSRGTARSPSRWLSTMPGELLFESRLTVKIGAVD